MDQKQSEEQAKEQYNITPKESCTLLKKCFVITPIGEKNSEIRRHIDGIIEAVLIPVLCDKFEVIAAHHINEPGNITKQIIDELYKSDLVIANLTGRNPNVMYELAVRHCMGRPTIMIAEEDTALPSDLISERTIFYRNDPMGVLELKEAIKNTILKIDFECEELKSPIHDVLIDTERKTLILKSLQDGSSKGDSLNESLSYLINKIDNIEKNIAEKKVHPIAESDIFILAVYLKDKSDISPTQLERIRMIVGEVFEKIIESGTRDAIEYTYSLEQKNNKECNVHIFFESAVISVRLLRTEIIKSLEENGFFSFTLKKTF